MINEVIGLILMIIGCIFYILASIGLIRMPDIFNRIQASTMASTLGVFSVLLGVGLYEPQFLIKVIVIAAFIAITNPIGSSVLARTAYLIDKDEVENTVAYFDLHALGRKVD